MRLHECVRLVGSGNLGFDLTDPYDCHVYLVDGGDELALVDAGSGMATEAILANVADEGLDPGRIRHLLLTHGHADHAGGAAALRARLPGLQVYVSEEVADPVRRGDAALLSVDAAREAGRYPVDYPFSGCEVDVELTDGARVHVGDLEVEAMRTPGHSAGDACFMLARGDERILFSGDLLFYGGTVLLQRMWDCRLEDLVRSLRRLRTVAATALLPGHMSVTLRDGQRHIERANEVLDGLRLPDQVQIPE